MMRILSRVPEIMRRGRNALRAEYSSSHDYSQLLEESQELRHRLHNVVSSLQAFLDLDDLSLLSNYTGPPSIKSLMHAIRSRSYALALTCGCFINRIISSLGGQTEEIVQESLQFSRSIICIGYIATKYRPLGSLYMLLCLVGSYVATDDLSIQAESIVLMKEYRQDLFGPPLKPPEKGLTWLRDRFRLRESCTYEEARGSDLWFC